MEDGRSSSLPSYAAPVAMPNFNSIPAEKWVAGEASISEVLNRVWPTSDSEDKRKDVIEYMQRLIKNAVGVEVFPYGSVPLRTYLPEGDIDLTAISNPDYEHNLPRDVFHVLLAEELNGNAEFELKEIRFIDAEVKLVKCIVGGIIIDVSFNQLGGLCSLCFLEKVDRLIEKEHLFKRSIILIKSWCYYESRILGAIHGLISTYALETLVLYIFHMYNASLTSPLMVLYRFLEYYSQFDWEKFCISIDGPVNVSLLPEIVVENPINLPLLGGEHLRNYINMFTVPCKESETSMPTFTPKVINIIDPLKENNNLGRSVHKGTFFRVTYALGYGARKLGEILELPSENIPDGIKKFFVNTLKRHQSKYIPKPTLAFDSLSSNSVSEVYYEDDNGDYIPKIDDVSNGGLSEGNDLSLEPANEEVDGDVNSISSLDNVTGDAIGGFDEHDNSYLADLTGDYDSNIRNLLFTQCCQGFPYSAALVDEPGGHPWAMWFHQNSSHSQPYPNGSVILTGSNLTVHGTGTFIPAMGPSTGGRGKGRGPSLPNRQLNRARGGSYEVGSSSGAYHNGPDPKSPQGHGQCSAPRKVHTQRRLEFGSFGPLLGNGFEAEETYFLRGRRQERVQDKPLPLMDENEFPPLSV